MAFQYLKGAYKKHGYRFFSRAHCHGLKMKEGTFRLHAREKFFWYEGGETVGQIAHRSDRCLIPGNSLIYLKLYLIIAEV